ncbi:DNA methyltransferase [Phaeobacter sp. HF9A]|uniref:DNA methyltransferase n=1 Tax=Phaeobacter sp. HF9A TaxID=2721561 RepID=UPI00142F5919|nr:DNA methyltransferase [Phaeobacter sp. HF9A]NIZ14067.1 site-specific DNA-methyltransferase [Phaeobacter sp. HF9A]
MKQKIKDNYVVFRDDHTEPPIYKSYIYRVDGDGDDGQKEVLPSVFYRHTQPANDLQRSIFGDLVFENPKDHEVLARLISYVTLGQKDCLIMDSFGGSGTTGHAVLDLNKRDKGNRKFILIEMQTHIAETVTAKRLKSLVDGYDSKVEPYETVPPLGGGFRYCRLGVPLFNEFGDIDNAVNFTDLAAHIFFAETGVPIPSKADGNSPYLGKHGEKAVYLLFAPGQEGTPREAMGNVLTPDALANLPAPPEGFEGSRVVYAEGCTVAPDRLKSEGVVFKQIPYQVEGV